MEDIYPNYDDPQFETKFNRNKEFMVHKFADEEPESIPDNSMEELISHYYQPYFYQTLAKYVMSPNTPYNRLLLNYNTGAGKTRTALDIAMEFTKIYKVEYELGLPTKHIFVIGFTKDAFKNELLKYPSMGFISKYELERLSKLKTKAMSNDATPIDKDRYKLLRQTLRRRITNERIGGFFKFYGYREFFNMMYKYIPKSTDDIKQLKNLSENEITDMITTGEIILNDDLMDMFHGSLLICDEIHEVYNKFNKNSWGMALQAVLDFHGNNMKALFISATPLNNSPMEILSIGNLLVLPENKLLEEDLFVSKSDINEFKPRYADILRERLMGKIAFVNNVDPRYYPHLRYYGDRISGIDYLKFNICHMTKLQEEAYSKLESINLENQFVMDIAIPPTMPGGEILISNEQFKSIAHANLKWKSKHKIDIMNETMMGEALHKNNIGEYSGKYLELLKWIDNTIIEVKNGKQVMSNGKIFIYHKFVQASGVKLIANILRMNGYINRAENSTGTTKCSICNQQKKSHISGTHTFKACRFITAYSEMNQTDMENSIEAFNDTNNVDGSEIKFLIGAGTVAQSRDFKAIRHICIMFYPNDISKLIQIIGRGNRTHSHIGLPMEMRNVSVRIFVGFSKTAQKGGYEVGKYRDKIYDYKQIQSIERVLYEISIDNRINANMNKKTIATRSRDEIGPLDYKINNMKLTSIMETTFKIFHSDEEIDLCINLIKRLFIGVSRVWTFNDLWKTIRDPPLQLQYNTALISKDSFICALDTFNIKDDSYKLIVDKTITDIRKENGIDNDDIYKIIQGKSPYILSMDGKFNTIIKKGQYYMMVPVDDEGNIIDMMESIYRDKLTYGSKCIDIKKYLETKDPLEYYERKKLRFMNKYKDIDLSGISKAICEYNTEFHIHFAEELITFIQNLYIKREDICQHKATYLKMMYYYDLLGLIVFADTIEADKVSQFKDYVGPSLRIDTCEPCIETPKDVDESTKQLIHMLESSINNSDCSWCPNASKQKFLDSVKSVEKVLSSPITKKVPSNMLPVGHRIGNTMRVLNPSRGWYSASFYDEDSKRRQKKIKENDIIIGYDEKSKTGIYTRFKIRQPRHKQVEHQDLRLKERGMVCIYKSKDYLLDLLKKLGVDIDVFLKRKPNLENLCEELRSTLILKELEERNKSSSNVKWFYYFWEFQ